MEKLTIYEVYVEMQDQAQYDRMKRFVALRMREIQDK